MVEEAKRLAANATVVDENGYEGPGEFLAVLGPDQLPIAIKSGSGTRDSLRGLQPALMKVKYGVELPAGATRVPVKLRVTCHLTRGCLVAAIPAAGSNVVVRGR
jgi:hypothetical protein